ncbi:C45 family autoproteolytic acyltransferase/hydolase [Pseudodesulfovibrio indicus]|uniref:Acyl-CoA--6-aminopenicillanic acid acyl-transferase n=1 Tax=Pseudodesulfovibrio indicus TaxID=1716143 RepID=A0A126QQW1_9BACT|nr:C45 family peptidase [Pseudodesulfovibrio indicus]AMK12127.1 acyl-CoA--6-aminopenicillanic acid acyl-transferase [Pseudodesulfovibrio indicus]TDT88731.1 isopenicillin-N N-acyltransferase-like protein [Pseudodesulfovibrio indicus]
MKTVPVIELSGTPFDMGLAHGRALKNLIREFVDSVTEVHRMNNGYLSVDKPPLETFCMKNLGFLEKFSPDLVEEMRGIAEGAGVTFREILYLNSFLELEDLRAPSVGARVLPDGLWGCTTFNVTREAGEGGRAYIGQTYDMEKYYEKFLCLLRITPEKGPSQLVVSFAGILGLNGLNSAGVGAVINKVTATDARPGVIYPFIMRKALASERIGDALGAAIFSPRAGGINYQFAGSGVAFCAETSAAYYQLLEIDGSIAHTNHFVGSDMRRFETPNWLSHGGSMVRRQVADNFLKKHRGTLNPEKLKELTRDHTNHPRCICAHGFPGEDPRTAFHTVFAVIMDPEAGWLDLCPGNPCENGYERHAL